MQMYAIVIPVLPLTNFTKSSTVRPPEYLPHEYWRRANVLLGLSETLREKLQRREARDTKTAAKIALGVRVHLQVQPLLTS